MGPGEEDKNTVIDPVLIEIVLPEAGLTKASCCETIRKVGENKVYVVSVEVKVKEQLDPYIDGGKLTFVDRDVVGVVVVDPEPDNEQSTVAVVDDEADGV